MYIYSESGVRRYFFFNIIKLFLKKEEIISKLINPNLHNLFFLLFYGIPPSPLTRKFVLPWAIHGFNHQFERTCRKSTFIKNKFHRSTSTKARVDLEFGLKKLKVAISKH